MILCYCNVTLQNNYHVILSLFRSVSLCSRGHQISWGTDRVIEYAIFLHFSAVKDTKKRKFGIKVA